MLVSFASQVLDRIEQTFRTVIKVNDVAVTVLLRTFTESLSTTYVATVTVAGIKVLHATIDIPLDTRPNAPTGYASYYEAVATTLRFAIAGAAYGQISDTTPMLPKTKLGLKGAGTILEAALKHINDELRAALYVRRFQPLRTKGNFAAAGFEADQPTIDEQIFAAVKIYHDGGFDDPSRSFGDTLRDAIKEQRAAAPTDTIRDFILKNTIRFADRVAV